MLVGLLLTGVASSSISLACSMAFSPISVGSSFKVQVSGYGGPVKGLRLNLSGGQGRTPSAVTDNNGIATFSDVPLGTQYLGADRDNGYNLPLKVTQDGPARIGMRWPSTEPIQVSSISGTMRAPDAIPGQLGQRVLSLDLLDAISGRVLASMNTSSRGEFDFGRPVPGIYLVRLNPYAAFNQQVGGLIGVAVDPRAPADKLDLNVVWTSCGLSYTDLRQCPRSDLRVRKLDGHVSDSMGRGVLRAEIVLLDQAQNPVVHVTTDLNGNFSFPGPLVGTFELRIDGGGFSPVTHAASHRTHGRRFITRNSSRVRHRLQHGPGGIGARAGLGTSSRS
jgi:hypothetical protein